MKYLDWNNKISGFFFNPTNAGNDTHIFITKADIINCGRDFYKAESDHEIWQSFLTRIKQGLPGSNVHGDIFDKANYAFQQSQRGVKAIEGIPVLFPPYIGYLAFAVLPLVEIQGDYNTNNYYDRLTDFLEENGIKQNLRNRLKEIEPLWSDLTQWANTVKNGELGYFRITNFVHQKWIYVGKPFSQCVLPPKSLSKLPQFFLSAGFVPGSFYPNSEIKRHLIERGAAVLGLSPGVIELVKKSDSNELGQSIIERIRREYSRWTGDSNIYHQSGTNERTTRNYTSARLYLQLEPNLDKESLKFSFRLFSTNDYPSDLKLSGHENLYEARGWSKTIKLPFRESFELKDELNKWVAKFPFKEVRLFLCANLQQMSSDYWLETDTLSRVDWTIILATSRYVNSIKAWCQASCAQFEDLTEFENVPAEYGLFKVLGPKNSHPDINLLTINTEKTVQLVSGLFSNFRTCFNDYLPEVEVANSTGTEQVYLQYRNSEEKIFLEKKPGFQNKWLLPVTVIVDLDFYIRIEGESFLGIETSYKIISSKGTARKLSGALLPKRDCYGNITGSETLKYCVGSNPVGISLVNQKLYEHFFKSLNPDIRSTISKPQYNNSGGNLLLSYLTSKGTSSTEEFYRVFEFLFLKQFANRTADQTFNFSKTKKASLNFFDYLGYLDYDYQSRQIVVNPPQLIYIPSNKGRTVLLIGGRDEGLIKNLSEKADEYNLQIEFRPQLESNLPLLLPDAITFKSYSSPGDPHGELALENFARAVGIHFTSRDLIQLGLQSFSAGIDEYEKNLIENNETVNEELNWARKVFNAETLKYDWDPAATYSKEYSLLEYKLNEYTLINQIWISGKTYSVDKNWGKYLALKHAGRHVILQDAIKEKVAIPIELPLPRLLSEALMLLSGIAPDFKQVNGRNYRIYENIPSIFIQNLFQKLKQTVIKCSL